MKIDIGKFVAITAVLACAGVTAPGCTIEDTDDDGNAQAGDTSDAGESSDAGASGANAGTAGLAGEEQGGSAGEGGTAGQSGAPEEGGAAGDPSAEGTGGSAGDPSAEGTGGSAGDPSAEGSGGSAGDPSAEGTGGSAGDPGTEGSGGAAGDPSAEGTGGVAGDPGTEGSGGAAGDPGTEGVGGVAGQAAGGGSAGAEECVPTTGPDPSGEDVICGTIMTTACDPQAEILSNPLLEGCQYAYAASNIYVAQAIEACISDASNEMADPCGEAGEAIVDSCLDQILDNVCSSEAAVTTCTSLITDCPELDAQHCTSRVSAMIVDGDVWMTTCMDPNYDPGFEGTCEDRFENCLLLQ